MAGSSPRPCPSDLTDERWALIEPMVPVKTGGRPAVHPRRRIVEAILYVTRSGCAWRMLPHDFPPWDTVYWYLQRWNADGTTERIHDALRGAVRKAGGREAEASAGIVDSQSVRGADTLGAETRGYDAGKKANGRKRHIVTDALGLLVAVLVTAASLQDRDGGRLVLAEARAKTPSLARAWADGPGRPPKPPNPFPNTFLAMCLAFLRWPQGVIATLTRLRRCWGRKSGCEGQQA